MGAPDIGQAGVDDLDQVMDLLAESIRWLRSRGLDQWSTWRTWRAKMLPALARGDVWLLRDGDDVVGTITVEAAGDTDFWTPDELAEPAAYLSKLAIRRAYAGRELGALLLDWAGDLAYRRGCLWLRLDAWKSNEQLHAYYRARGWAYLRTVANPRRRSGALFQRPARPLSLASAHQLPGALPGTALDTLRCAPPAEQGAAGDPAGNWTPAHLHVGALTVEYQWIGPALAVFVPGMRYRVRQAAGDDDGWLLEASWDGSPVWERHGQVLDATWPLTPGSVYVITHREGSSCGMARAEPPPGAPP